MIRMRDICVTFRRERQEKIDRALQAARLASLASLALKNRGRSPGAKETP